MFVHRSVVSSLWSLFSSRFACCSCWLLCWVCAFSIVSARSFMVWRICAMWRVVWRCMVIV